VPMCRSCGPAVVGQVCNEKFPIFCLIQSGRSQASLTFAALVFSFQIELGENICVLEQNSGQVVLLGVGHPDTGGASVFVDT
jgi:hypothetical protein